MRYIAFLLGLLSATLVFADTAFDAPGNANPIVPGYFADPTIRKFGDTFYLYATTDGNGGGRGPAQVWVSKDFVNWTLVPMNWPTTPHYWAPDVVQRNGRYYLYYNQPCITYGAVSDSPIGPWTPLTQPDGLVIPDRLVKDVITLDTQSFEDKDGSLYMYWGTWGIFANSGCGVGKINPDMKTFERLGMIPNTQAKDFFEAPFMIERNGVYYFTYSSGSCHDASYRVQYAVGNKPDGDFVMGPNNPILATSADRTIHGPGHHSILSVGDEHYIVYHRHNIPFTPNGMHRQLCADRLIFERDGEIRKIEPTHQGIGSIGAKPDPSPNLARGKKVTASSFYRDTLRKHDFKPEYAVDDNNATLWRPADNRPGHWLMVDLGSPQRICRTATQFEYATWSYQYLIEHSPDGQTWQTFADRRSNTRWGSPLVDKGDITARYLRITTTGTSYPGLFGAIWNFKVFADAPEDPLEAMAVKAFEEIVAPTQKPLTAQSAPQGLLVHLDVAGLQLGAPVTSWKNQGALGGEFISGDMKPVVDMAAGRKAVRFAGRQFLRGSMPAPRSLAGNSSFTVAVWVFNPEIAEGECIVSWAGRGGPDAATAQLGYGSHRGWGAVGHWGFADMGFRGGVPKAGAWHHFALVFDGVTETLYVNGQVNAQSSKMLMLHEGRPIYVGASDPNTERFDGFLASLRIYDGPLGDSEVRKLAAQEPEADVLVHVDSAKQDFGPLKSWANNGLIGGAFSAGAAGPAVEDVAGRIATRFAPGDSVQLNAEPAMPVQDLTLLLSVWNPTSDPQKCPLQIIAADGSNQQVSVPITSQGWQQIAIVSVGSQGRLYVNGQPADGQVDAIRPVSIKTVRVGNAGEDKSTFNGALARLQLFRRALEETEIRQLADVWKREWQTPAPSPAVFAQQPQATSTTTVSMLARPGQSEAAGIEYRFTETTGNPGGRSSSWQASPFFLNAGLKPNARYAYTVMMRDALGNLAAASKPAEVMTDASLFDEFTDDFTKARNYLAAGTNGTAGTIWDGLLATEGGSATDAIIAADGILRLQSAKTRWDGSKPRGLLLHKLVKGDFVVQVKVADYAGLANRRVPGNNDGGLMVRVPDLSAAGPGEDLVQLNFFPIYDQGNMWTSLDDRARPQVGNRLAWDAHRYLQIERRGAFFHFRTSPDGVQWIEMPSSPVERKDMAGLPVQVGLCHAAYGESPSYITFSDFRLTVRREAQATLRQAHPFSLNDVRLLDGPFKHAQDVDAAYLLKLEPDRLLSRFREYAGLKPKAPHYGGWEAMSLSGHTLGHYLSACAMMFQATGDVRFRERAQYIIAELELCQQAHGDGYLAGFPDGRKAFEEVAKGNIRASSFNLNGVWSPFYTLHKLFAGLRDAHRLCQTPRALEIEVKLAGWVEKTLAGLNDEQLQQVLSCEFGGMNEVLADLSADAKDPRWMKLSHRFDHKAVYEPLARGEDCLPGLHANTQIPKFVGLAMRHELTGDKLDRQLAEFFHQRVTQHHSYVTGGNSECEYFGPPGELNHRLSTRTTETCNTHNMLKLTRQLWLLEPRGALADYYERAMWNHILASQDPRSGMVTYFVPLRSGFSKHYTSPFDTFTCCLGTGMENHAAYGDNIYFHAGDVLWVNQFIASELNWRECGLTLRQDTRFPDDGVIQLTMTCAKPAELELRLRHPTWAAGKLAVTINDQPQEASSTPGGYLSLRRTWNNGDRIRISIPMPLRLEAMPDNPSRVAIFHGPVLLAGALDSAAKSADAAPALVTGNRPPADWIKPVEGEPGAFRTIDVGRPRDVKLIPFHRMHHQPYAVYWDLCTEQQLAQRQADARAEQALQAALDAMTVDRVTPGDGESEKQHNVRGEAMEADDYNGRNYRLSRGKWFSYDLAVLPDEPVSLVCTWWGGERPGNRIFDIFVDDQLLVAEKLPDDRPDRFYDRTYPLPPELTRGKTKVTIKLVARENRSTGGVFGMRTVRR